MNRDDSVSRDPAAVKAANEARAAITAEAAAKKVATTEGEAPPGGAEVKPSPGGGRSQDPPEAPKPPPKPVVDRTVDKMIPAFDIKELAREIHTKYSSPVSEMTFDEFWGGMERMARGHEASKLPKLGAVTREQYSLLIRGLIYERDALFLKSLSKALKEDSKALRSMMFLEIKEDFNLSKFANLMVDPGTGIAHGEKCEHFGMPKPEPEGPTGPLAELLKKLGAGAAAVRLEDMDKKKK